jgi:hypothetical protein
MLAKINKLTNWQAALIIAILGFAVYFTGLHNPFQGDDISQIVNNPVVHSLSHILLLFKGGTFFYNGNIAPLSGVWFRPLMMVVFSVIYAIFGLHAFYYHLIQLLLCIGSSYLLYLIFKRFFGSILALVLALIFLVHPINSQVVLAIPSMQDALFFFFGILAFWLLIRFKSLKIMLLIAFCLFLSLLSKESGILFVAVCLLYLLIFKRKRFYPFLYITIIPVTLWMALKVHAVGLAINPHAGPIDSLSLGGRLLTMPSIMLFYLSKLVFPLRLASIYHWVHPTFSLRYVLVPLIIDSGVISLMACAGWLLYQKKRKEWFHIFLFFAIWAAIGLMMHLQFTPLDMTVCETWFYFSMVGVLGMIGVLLVAFQEKINPYWFTVIALIVIALFGVRTALRGTDWSSPYKLASQDIIASPDDYIAYNTLASYYYDEHDLSDALLNIQKSINIYPNGNNYNIQGAIYTAEGNFALAKQAYDNGLKFQTLSGLYDNLAAITPVYGNTEQNIQFLQSVVHKHPNDANLWFYLAVEEFIGGDKADSFISIKQAYSLVPTNQAIQTDYFDINHNEMPIITFNPKPVPE